MLCVCNLYLGQVRSSCTPMLCVCNVYLGQVRSSCTPMLCVCNVYLVFGSGQIELYTDVVCV